ncbi:MAG: TatD family hydrolase [Ruminococcus sp.]|nr:TatD family hydrolase [Ruminococcus sp.]
MKPEYIDIGLNLFCSQFREPERIMREAHEAGVQFIITGADMKSSEAAARFVRTRNCYATAGIHPHDADRARPEDFKRLRELYSQERVVAVGECGLDYNRMFSTVENQLDCLKRQIELAEETGLPMFLHERDAFEELVKSFEGHEELCKRSVVHCFTGTAGEVKKYLDMGFHIGITGWICDDRRAEALREAVKHIPADRLMIETDAPYLTPRNVKGLGRVNLPQNIVYVAAELARYKGIPEEELKARLLENTKRFFKL